MIEPQHPALPVSRQCALVGISRSAWYGPRKGENPLNLALMRLIDAQFLETPWYGSRQMARHLRRQGHVVGRKRVRRLMAKMGLAAVYQRPRTTVPHPEHQDLAVPAAKPRRSTGRTRSGAPTSRTSRCGGAFSTSWRSWTGRAGACWRGGCRTPWTRTSASRPSKRRWPAMAGRRSSTPTRAASSPAPASPTS